MMIRYLLVAMVASVAFAACNSAAVAPAAPSSLGSSLRRPDVRPQALADTNLRVANSASNTVTTFESTGLTRVSFAGAVSNATDVSVANFRGSTVTDYSPKVVPVRGATGPSALAFDVHRNLYVANQNANSVTVYAANQGAISRTITRGIENPRSLAFDGSGNLYVGSARWVTVYEPGSDVPSRRINNVSHKNDALLAFDSAGVLYVASYDHFTEKFDVAEYLPGENTPIRSIITGIKSVNELAIDAADDLCVVGEREILIYAKGSASPKLRITDGIRIARSAAFDRSGMLYVANAAPHSRETGSVTEYAPGGTSPLHKITDGIQDPEWLTVDAAGTLYVANLGGGSISGYAPGAVKPFLTLASDKPTVVTLRDRDALAVASHDNDTAALYRNIASKPLRTIASGIKQPYALAFDAAGNEYVANYLADTITVYAPEQTTILRTISAGVKRPVALAFDRAGKLYVANYAGDSVTVYAPGSSTPSLAISNGVKRPRALAFDSIGDLYVANEERSTVTVYNPANGAPVEKVSAGVSGPFALALDTHDDLFVANYKANTVTVYEPGVPTLLRTIGHGIAKPRALAFDAAGNLFVASQGRNWVTVYAPGKIGVSRIYSAGLSEPVALAIDGAGDLYVASYGNNRVQAYRINPPYAGFATLSAGVDKPIAVAVPTEPNAS